MFGERSKVSTSSNDGPDNIPVWTRRKFADFFTFTIADILDTSFRDCKVPKILCF